MKPEPEKPELSESCPWCRTYVIPGDTHLCCREGERYCTRCYVCYMDGLTHVCADGVVGANRPFASGWMEKMLNRQIPTNIRSHNYTWSWDDRSWSDHKDRKRNKFDVPPAPPPPPFAPPSSQWYEQYQRLMVEKGRGKALEVAMKAQFDMYGPKTFPALPVDKSTECVTGYRKWNLRRVYPQGWVLSSLNSGKFSTNPYARKHLHEIWPGYEAKEAVCNRVQLEVEGHKPPMPECACGIHAYKEPIPLDGPVIDMPTIAYGTIKMWGTVVEHTSGYRAQYAYPSHLAIIGETVTERMRDDLERGYGVSVELWD